MIPMPVLFVPFRGSPASTAAAPLKRKREALWGNAERNEFVAGIANRVARKPRHLLRDLGVTSEAVRWPERVRQRVVILVEGVEHARRMQRLLPGWEVRHAVPVEREPDDVEDDPNEPPPPGVVATLVYAARAGLRCDVLVRATGAAGELDWDCVRGVGRSVMAPALVIDVQDRFDDRSRTETDVRRREYRRQGLVILDAGVPNT